MHVVTFYSFKGGTGRSMALMNVAADLLQRGRRILLVDFDLEAPGLDTFPLTMDEPVDGGILEFIDHYLESDTVPSVENFTYRASIKGIQNKNLWIMAAGKQDSSYDSRFKAIDWGDLYDNQQGYLLFEDMKLQWEDLYNPDYVLIDSRTGHTDIGGICTRQLPDSVVITFFPNEQNLRGLKSVVEDIRTEIRGPLSQSITLHFAISNLPNVADEEDVLADALAKSKKILGYDELAAVIHHLDSLSMISQRMFVVDRPKSTLANEYRQLSNAIVNKNFMDKEGAINLLQTALVDARSRDTSERTAAVEESLKKVKLYHPSDPAILVLLARLRKVQRKLEEALSLYDQLVLNEISLSESLLARTEIYVQTGRTHAALDDLSRFFACSDVSPLDFAIAVRIKIQLGFSDPEEILNSPAVPGLPIFGLSEVIQELQRSYETNKIAAELARIWIDKNPTVIAAPFISNVLVLSFIGAGRFEDACSTMLNGGSFEKLVLPDTFNYAMAQWGISGAPPVEVFRQIVDSMADEDTLDPNHLQCISLANWVVGNKDRAIDLFFRAEKSAGGVRDASYSCWSYLYVSAKSFLDDLYEMKSLYEGFPLAPRFMRNAAKDGRAHESNA